MADPFVSDPDFVLHVGDALETLQAMPAESVHCCVTSPPYWGLRDYGTGAWDGGDAECDHTMPSRVDAAKATATSTLVGSTDTQGHLQEPSYKDTCGKCGATRVDQQLGLEPTPDAYITRMVQVFREVRRVLRADGTLWLNIGDSYAGSWGAQSRGSADEQLGRSGTDLHGDLRVGGVRDTSLSATQIAAHPKRTHTGSIPQGSSLKPKDLVGIPWLLARALQEPYYTGRIPRERDRVWLAATLDAEGTICDFSHDRKDDGRTRTGLLFNITNSSEALLAEATRIWPANLHRHLRNGEGHLGRREMWRWHVNGIENKTALVRELYPHMIVKRTQALLAYNLLVLMADAKRAARTPQHGAILEKRALLVRLLSDANQGRPFDVPSWCVEPPTLFEPGWYLRSDIIWAKPNPMPESVTDRPTKAHEYLFLLTKSPRYYFDQDAIREAYVYGDDGRLAFTGQADGNERRGISATGPDGRRKTTVVGQDNSAQHRNGERWPNPTGRNKRSVWEIATEPYPDAHFATFPQALVEPCIKAGTSEHGCCPVCGAPWVRETERTAMVIDRSGVSPYDHHSTRSSGRMLEPPTSQTTGWRPSCGHEFPGGVGGPYVNAPVPCVVLDPFLGSGTTAQVARRLGRRSIGIELNPEYAELAARRLQQQTLFACVVDESAGLAEEGADRV